MARLNTQRRQAQPQMQQQVQMPASIMAPSPGLTAANYSFYTYGVFLENVGASGGTKTASIVIDNDADFDWHASTYFATSNVETDLTAATRIIPAFTLDIQTQDTQRISNIALPLSLWFGTGELPMVLPAVRRLARRTVVTFNATNLSGNTMQVWLGLIGKKLYS